MHVYVCYIQAKQGSDNLKLYSVCLFWAIISNKILVLLCIIMIPQSWHRVCQHTILHVHDKFLISGLPKTDNLNRQGCRLSRLPQIGEYRVSRFSQSKGWLSFPHFLISVFLIKINLISLGHGVFVFGKRQFFTDSMTH